MRGREAMLSRFVQGVRRSALFHVLAIFLASGWAVLQILDAFIDNGLLPAWTFRGAVGLLLIGLPIVLTTAYMQGRIGREANGGTAPASRSSDDDDAATDPAAEPVPHRA